MNIATLEYFISAAEASSFTQAAKQHFVAQTAISQQIAKLEQELSVKLFERTKNRVELTEAGRCFYEDIVIVLEKYKLAKQKVQKFHEANQKVITIGYKERYELQLLTKVIHDYQRMHPNVEFIIREADQEKLIDDVKQGVCDFFVNISCAFSEKDFEVLESYHIYKGDMLLAVSIEHPFAEAKRIEGKELGNERFIVLKSKQRESGLSELKKHCNQDGYEPQIMEFVENIGTQLMKVELNQGVAFVQDLMPNPQPDRIRYLSLHNSYHQYEVALVWNRENKEEHVKQFIRFIKRELSVKKA